MDNWKLLKKDNRKFINIKKSQLLSKNSIDYKLTNKLIKENDNNNRIEKNEILNEKNKYHINLNYKNKMNLKYLNDIKLNSNKKFYDLKNKVNKNFNNLFSSMAKWDSNRNNDNSSFFKTNYSSQNIKNKTLKLSQSKNNFSLKNSLIKGYSVNSTNGLIKNYNEDRVSIIVNIEKKEGISSADWPNCSYFALFDGHGGKNCAEFLKKNLHLLIINSKFFPSHPKKAIEEGFSKAEKIFLKKSINSFPKIEKSGSCAIILLIVNKICYFANLGDSRAIGSSDKGKKIIKFTKDHKPEMISEKERIEQAGGYIYKTKTSNRNINYLPYRIFPGGLSVSRSFGDIYAKLRKLGGNSKVLISKPDITSLNLNNQLDFILIGCDGIWDKFKNSEIMEFIWKKLKINENNNKKILDTLVNNILIESMNKESYDNLTWILILL